MRKAAETVFSGLALPLVEDFQITMNQKRLFSMWRMRTRL